MFAQWTSQTLSRALISADPDLAGKASEGDLRAYPYDPARMGKLEDTLKRYEDHFNRHLRILMDRSVHCQHFLAVMLTDPSLNYFAATESVVLLKLAHSLSSISKED